MKAENYTKINFRLGEIRENKVVEKNRFLNSFAVIATGLRLEDRLDGAVNFRPLKARIVLILQENELWEIMNNSFVHSVTIPTVAADKAAFDKLDIQAKRILLDAIKDHIIPHIYEKDYAH